MVLFRAWRVIFLWSFLGIFGIFFWSLIKNFDIV